MTDTNNPASSSLDTAALVALGLVGAGLAIGVGVLLGDAERRETCGRIMQDLGVPQALRTAASMILFAAAKTVRGLGDVDVLGGIEAS